MKLAFCLFNYFPYGGLQRDFLRIARACQQRGHEVHVFTSRWEAEVEPFFQLHFIKTRGWRNDLRCLSFAKQLKSLLAQQSFDLVVGFNKMPHLDMYYAADVCYQARVKERRGFLYRLLPRYRHMMALEEAVFAAGCHTQIMLISALQEVEYTKCYQTEAERFHLLPPGIAKDRMAPLNAAELRKNKRQIHQVSDHELVVLMVGSGFKTKGLDRAIESFAALPSEVRERSQLWVIGQDNPRSFQRLANKRGVGARIHFLGGRPDVPEYLLAADILLHPAYHENTGTVLLEALASGLPVLTLDVCGYAHYVTEADAGMVLPSPFMQTTLNAALEMMLLSSKRPLWQQNALTFSRQADIYSLPEKAADLIETVGRKRDSIPA